MKMKLLDSLKRFIHRNDIKLQTIEENRYRKALAMQKIVYAAFSRFDNVLSSGYHELYDLLMKLTKILLKANDQFVLEDYLNEDRSFDVGKFAPYRIGLYREVSELSSMIPNVADETIPKAMDELLDVKNLNIILADIVNQSAFPVDIKKVCIGNSMFEYQLFKDEVETVEGLLNNIFTAGNIGKAFEIDPTIDEQLSSLQNKIGGFIMKVKIAGMVLDEYLQEISNYAFMKKLTG